MFAGDSLNLEKGCRAHSEQLANNSKYIGRGSGTYFYVVQRSIIGYLLHNRGVFLHITSLIDMQIAWAMHYEQLD